MKSKKMFAGVVALAAFALVSMFGVTSVDAYPRASGGTAQTAVEDSGNTMDPFYAAVGTTTAVAVYAKTAARVDRKLVICNAEAFDLFVSTFAGANATTSPGISVPQNQCLELISPPKSLWAIYESASGGTPKRVTGYKQYDSRD